ncbi:MAG TPA: serine/threonine-protein kinase [Polyangiaceae bacterium]|jgi:serine/threonine-protein kinase
MNPPPSSDLGRAGQVVGGKYRLDAMIGRGGMGSVWAATHVGLGRRLAVKLIAREYVRSPEALRRFEAEAKAAARLESRHVVGVFDNGTLDDGTPFIAMELLQGETVSDRVERAGPLPLDATVELLAQCCRALAHAHAAGIVHRDIKPDNIFLAREPDTGADVVKVLDFGVAKITLDVGESSSQITGTGALLGTPLYMSPEQVRGARDVDHRTDLYSLGLVAFTMLTGKVAIQGEAFGDILLKICTAPLPKLLASAPGLPPAMEAWFERACAREPGGRHASAQEFVDSLRAAAGAPHQVLASSASMFGDTAGVASTLAAPAARLPSYPSAGPALAPSLAAASPLAPAPAFVPTPALAQPPMTAVSGAGPLPVSELHAPSAAAVSLTTGGIPRNRGGAVALAVVGGAVLVAVGAVLALSLRGSSSPATALPMPTPSAAARSITPPEVVSLVPPAEAVPAPPALADASRPGTPTTAGTATAAGASPPNPPHAPVEPGRAAALHPLPSGVPAPPPAPRPAHTIDLGY